MRHQLAPGGSPSHPPVATYFRQLFFSTTYFNAQELVHFPAPCAIPFPPGAIPNLEQRHTEHRDKHRDALRHECLSVHRHHLLPRHALKVWHVLSVCSHLVTSLSTAGSEYSSSLFAPPFPAASPVPGLPPPIPRKYGRASCAIMRPFDVLRESENLV
ncbi:hypothetical protein EDB83DRAFT_2407587, partial [Lactarius deliciosus]